MSSAKKLDRHFLNSEAEPDKADLAIPSIIEIAPVGQKRIELAPEKIAIQQNQDILNDQADLEHLKIESDEHTVTIWANSPQLLTEDETVSESLFNTVLNLSKQMAPTLRQSINKRPQLAKKEFQSFLDRLTVQEQSDRRILKNGVRLAIEVLGFDYVLECNLNHPGKLADQVFALNDYQQKTGFGIERLKLWISQNPTGWESEVLVESGIETPTASTPDDQNTIAESESNIHHYPIHFHYGVGTLGPKKSNS